MTLGFLVSFVSAITPLLSTFCYYISKMHTVNKICNHPELSDEKVKHITAMMSSHFFFK